MRYRIIERIDSLGKSLFFIQHKGKLKYNIRWQTFFNFTNATPYSFLTLKEAREALVIIKKYKISISIGCVKQRTHKVKE